MNFKKLAIIFAIFIPIVFIYSSLADIKVNILGITFALIIELGLLIFIYKSE